MSATADATYQGWANYETWAAALWLDNDEPAYRHWAGEAARLKARLRPGEAARVLATLMGEWADRAAPDLGPTLWADLLRAALDDVNWAELAAHYLSGD